MKKVQAVGDKVVVDILDAIEKKTDSGLIIPDTVADTSPNKYGKVISVGEDIKTINPDDIVVYHQRAGQDFIVDKKIYKVLMYGEIYGVLKDE